MIKKIKDKIIVKLGGVTKEQYLALNQNSINCKSINYDIINICAASTYSRQDLYHINNDDRIKELLLDRVKTEIHDAIDDEHILFTDTSDSSNFGLSGTLYVAIKH